MSTGNGFEVTMKTLTTGNDSKSDVGAGARGKDG